MIPSEATHGITATATASRQPGRPRIGGHVQGQRLCGRYCSDGRRQTRSWGRYFREDGQRGRRTSGTGRRSIIVRERRGRAGGAH